MSDFDETDNDVEPTIEMTTPCVPPSTRKLGVAELEALKAACDAAYAEREAIKLVEADVEERKRVVAAKERLIFEALESAGLPEFTAATCKYKIYEDPGVQAPKTPQDWVKVVTGLKRSMGCRLTVRCSKCTSAASRAS
jgi:hypothetical protein